MNVLPRRTVFDVRHGRATDAVMVGDCLMSAGHRENFDNLRRCQARISDGTPTLRETVAEVIASCAQKQMLGVHASGVVAAMEYAKAIRDWPVMQLPRYARRLKGFGSSFVADVAVPLLVFVSRPFPAAVRLLDFRPETIG